jgi:lipopolysaccharide/colanic/teichoic acid biosynthesis glycosyltransferase
MPDPAPAGPIGDHEDQASCAITGRGYLPHPTQIGKLIFINHEFYGIFDPADHECPLNTPARLGGHAIGGANAPTRGRAAEVQLGRRNAAESEVGGMRIRSPSSRAKINVRFVPVDFALAALAPYLALYLRNAMILSNDKVMVFLYCSISLTFSMIAFAIYRIENVIPRYFSVGDALNLAKAVLIAELGTGIVLFSTTRLDGVPRSVPAIHALILGVGLLAARGFARLADRRDVAEGSRPASREHIILIGLNDLSILFVQFLGARAPVRQQVIGLLDPEPRWIGRSVQGVRVFGPPSHLEALIEEFAVHGIRTDRVLISDASGILPERELQQIRHVCAERNLDLNSVQEVLGSQVAKRAPDVAPVATVRALDYERSANLAASPYFRRKGRIEFVAALALAPVLLPLGVLAAALAFLDVGSPILFWQQRIGLRGRDFQLYKVRTLRSAFDRNGRKTPEEQRLSWIGRLLRQTRLDELPQLLNVLVGDMSLIGPRPLLARDQPPDPAVRLMVRPGITGWAQVNGGSLLSPEEKEALDAWYIRNASLWLDLRIIAMTVNSFVRGDRRCERPLAQARNESGGRIGAGRVDAGRVDGGNRGSRREAASRSAAAAAELPAGNEAEAPADRSASFLRQTS